MDAAKITYCGPCCNRRRAGLAVALAPWIATGCGSNPAAGEPPSGAEGGLLGLFKPTLASIGGTVTAAADLNPSANGRPSPLPLRLYELKGEAAFSRADFLGLYERDAQVLGADLLARQELVIAPGESKTVQKVLQPETRFLAVFGAYRAFEQASWRAVAPVRKGQKQRLTVRAERLAVSIELVSL